MSLDELQQRWQSQGEARLRVEPELLLGEMRRNQRNFKLTIFWRDFREVFVGAVMAVFFGWKWWEGDHWPLLAAAVSMVWVVGFILIDRFMRRGRTNKYGESLLGCVESSLEDVEHQIWLLQNVFWWYLLPPGIALTMWFAYMAMKPEASLWMRLVAFSVPWGICVLVYWGVYWLNQLAVRAHLEPRRQELLAVRESLLKEGEES
jgi:hypothetical protein